VHVNSLNMQIGQRGSIQPALWAFGFLGEDESETLGTWLVPASFQTLSQTVLEDLKLRGVEKVRFFVCNDPAEVRADACFAYPGSTVLPSVGHLLCQSLAEVAPRDRRALADTIGAVAELSTARAARDAVNELATGSVGASYPAVVERWSAALEQLGPLFALSARQRRVIRSVDGIVQQLHQSLNGAVARHGTFADDGAAMSFLAETLQRAERRLDGRGTDRAANPATAAVRPKLGSQALAF
jgi:transposase-like protein